MAPKLIGFVGSGFIGAGDGHGQEMAAVGANTTWIYAWESPEKTAAKIREAASHVPYIVLDVEWIFFYTPDDWPRVPPALAYALRPDADVRWAQWFAALAPVWHHVTALYHIDEPFMRGARKATAGQGRAFQKDVMALQLQTVNAWIKQTTATPVFCIFSWAELLPGHELEMPSSHGTRWGFDAAGFDAYSDAARNGVGDTPEKYGALLAALLAKCPVQWLVIVPDGQMFPEDTEAAKLARVDALWDFAMHEPRVLAVFAYCWRSVDTPTEKYLGTKDVPFLRERFQARAAALMGEHDDTK